MRVKSKLGLRLAAVGVVIGAAGLPLVGATAAHAAAPTLAADPSTGLSNGSSISVTGTGFGPTATAYLVECSGLTGATACDNATLVTAPTDATGAFTATFTAEEGTVGDGACYPTDTCYIAATTDPTNPTDTAQASATPITFAAATAPAAYVTPSTGVTNAESLRVVGVDFTASHLYSIVECSGLTGAAACDSADAVTGNTDANGNLTAAFAAKTGTIGNGTCAAGSSNCYLIVDADPATPSDTTEVAFVNLTFAKATTTGPVLKLTPSSNVKSGASISVKGSGFPAKAETVYLVECSSTTKGQAACDLATLVTGSTSATGTFTAKVKVHSGAVGNGKCAAGGACYIAASVSTATKPPAGSQGAAKFTFAKAAPVTKIGTSLSAHATKTGIAGALRAKGSGLKGFKVVLVLVKGQKASQVKSATTGKGGAFSFKVSKAGKYVVGFGGKKVGTKQYKSSNSKSINLK